MSIDDKLNRALALNDDIERYEKHRQFKKTICDIAGINSDGAIPNTLTTAQLAKLCTDCERLQKIIVLYFSPKEQGNYYGLLSKSIHNSDIKECEIIELSVKLNFSLPDIVLWWLRGSCPANVILHSPQDKTDINQLENEKTTPQSKYDIRNNDYIAWVKNDNPDIANMKKADIEQVLIMRNKIWIGGFNNWWKQKDRPFKNDIPTKSGRPKKTM